MRLKSRLSHIMAALLAWLLAVSAVGCMITGFGFDQVDMGRMVLIFALASGLLCLCFCFRRGGLVLLCLAALAAGFLWREGTLWAQSKTLLYRISSLYDNAYGCGRLDLGAAGGSGPLDMPLTAIGMLVSFFVSWVICRHKRVFYALPAVLLPLICCTVVTDTVPAERYLFGLLLGVALLLMTDWVRRNSHQDGRLTAMLAVPTAAALAVLFLAVPQTGYVSRAEQWQGQLLNWAERLQALAEDIELPTSETGETSGERVNLRAVGPRVQGNYAVMQVTAPTGGAVYLRGQDFSTYSGTGWSAARNRQEIFTEGADVLGELKIKTYGARQLLYVPYYPAGETVLTGGCLENSGRLTEYTFPLASAPVVQTASAQPDSQYLQLPADTLRWARELASALIQGVPDTDAQARSIASYVRSSASYDLNTPKMPSDTGDFVRWFLEESETGYCVHFATAATVLLRAAGIPARYVEGYLISCQAGEQTTVTGKCAHAWAEYYDSATGAWRILEATPAAAEAEQAPEQPQISGASEPATATEDTAAAATASAPADRETTFREPAAAGQSSGPSGPLKRGLTVLFWCVLAILAVWLQSRLRLWYQRRRWNRGSPNKRALARWSQVCHLAWVLHMPVPRQLEELAQKARFSQHTLTAEELAQFDAFRREASRVIAAMHPVKKLALRLIFAAE